MPYYIAKSSRKFHIDTIIQGRRIDRHTIEVNGPQRFAKHWPCVRPEDVYELAPAVADTIIPGVPLTPGKRKRALAYRTGSIPNITERIKEIAARPPVAELVPLEALKTAARRKLEKEKERNEQSNARA